MELIAFYFLIQYSEIKPYPLCLGNFLKNLTLSNTKKKSRIKGILKVFSIDHDPINTNEILDIHRFSMKEI